MRISFVLAALGALVALAGCGDSGPQPTPVACLRPASAYLDALASAPGEVRIGGTTPISACLVEDQPAGPLEQVGRSAVGAATELNRRVLRDGRRSDMVRLGYLVGAVQEGASTTGGIHRELVRRLDVAARYPGPGGRPLGVRFERAYGAGYAAGQASG